MTLYLHVGAHKTGTTTIQQYSSARRPLLLSKGLCYPDFAEIGRPPAPSHHAFAHAIAGEATRPPFTESEIEAFVDLCARHSQERDVLVSAEAIFRHQIGTGSFSETHRAYVEVLARRLRRIPEVVPIVCIRRQDNFAVSMAQEQIKTMSTTRLLPQFAAENAEFMDFEAQIALFEAAFGSAKVLVYERLIAGDGLIRNFFRELGVSLTEGEAEFKAFNPSLHPAMVLYKLELNRQGKSAGLPQAVLFQASEDLFGRERRSLFAADEMDRIFASYTESNERIGRRLGLPQGEPLFPERDRLPPRYEALLDEDFHRIKLRISQLRAEGKEKAARNRPSKARPKSLWRRLLTRLGWGEGLR